MVENEQRVEARLRRLAQRQDLVLRKSRRRDPDRMDFGTFWLVEPNRNLVMFGDEWGATLDEIEEHLRKAARRPRRG